MMDRITLRCGDCREEIASIADASIDSVVTDPPYALAFMGKIWDSGEAAFDPAFWREVYRVLKPGGHVIAMGGTRTYHRLACAIEDAGFEIRDQIGWAYGSGFPKSHNVGDGWGTALKPAWEPCCLARKPLSEDTVAANVLAHGTGAINIDACRVGTEVRHAAYTSFGPCHGNQLGAAGTAEARRGTQGEPKEYVGRWPANLIHDGSEEVLAAFPESKAGEETQPRGNGGIWSGVSNAPCGPQYGDSGSAARFFYTAKADTDERIGSKHPTVKPVDLMQYLIRLITPPGGLVLDPFAGTGTVGEAAYREGMRAVLIEREAEYQQDIRRRIELLTAGPMARSHAIIKHNGKAEPLHTLPLFEGWDEMWSRKLALTESEQQELL
jgi:site-specific DNA-methyltransferase (adenine-specific)